MLAAAGYTAEEIAALHEGGAVAGLAAATQGSFLSAGAATAPRTDGMLKMSELAERSGVSAATIKHYLREGLLGTDRRSCGPPATWRTTRSSSSSASG